MTWFVYIQGMKGPEPQKWEEMPVDGNGKYRDNVLKKIKLTPAEATLGLGYLAMKYPYAKSS